MGVLNLTFPYNQCVATNLYLKGYMSKFMLFNGKKGNIKEQLLKFIETLDMYGIDDDLKLKEFSKSLIEKGHGKPCVKCSWINPSQLKKRSL